jgi:DNA-binding NtrC family response regulator
MSTHVLLVDNNAARSRQRRHDMASAGVQVTNAFDEQQVAEAMDSVRIDVICVDSQFVSDRGAEIGALMETRMRTVPVVLILDDAQVPGNLQSYVDVVVDREDFPTKGTQLMQDLDGGQVPFFQRWFCEWVGRASLSRRNEAVPTC